MRRLWNDGTSGAGPALAIRRQHKRIAESTYGIREDGVTLSTAMTVQRHIADVMSHLLTCGDIVSTELGLRARMVEANSPPVYVFRTVGKLPTYSLRLIVGIFVVPTVIRLSARYPAIWKSVSISNWFAAIVISLTFCNCC